MLNIGIVAMNVAFCILNLAIFFYAGSYWNAAAAALCGGCAVFTYLTWVDMKR